jgi:monoamine oxidase
VAALTSRIDVRAPRPLTVAVVGAGFAGMAAAAAFHNSGIDVTVYEPYGEVGGRVRSDHRLIPGRIVEAGAELIGSNHPVWLHLARALDLGLSVLTTSDDYDHMGLTRRMRMGGQVIDQATMHRLEPWVERALDDLSQRARAAMPASLSHRPWDAPDAAANDARSIREWIDHVVASLRPPRDVAGLLGIVLDFELENHMTVPTRRQSLLAHYAAIAGGGYERYWTETEVYRCESGNDALAKRLAAQVRAGRNGSVRLQEKVTHLTVGADHVEVLSESTVASLRIPPSTYDYVVLTAPPTTWGDITIDGSRSWYGRLLVQCGPAVKYLAHVPSRYWLARDRAPAAFHDRLGQVWESTDNQTGDHAIGLTVFAGGPVAARPEGDYPAGIAEVLPGFHAAGRHLFANWPAEEFVKTGYACPAPGQVTTVVRALQEPFRGRIYFAGEHCSPDFFGYMEGALQSGLAAYRRILDAEGIVTASTARP